MAREDFLAALGASLTKASDLTGRNRALNRQAELDKQQREMELARMALQRDQFDLEQKGFDAAQTRDARGFAKDVLEDAGPNAVLDPAAVQTVTAGGLGHRLTEPTLRIGPETQGAEVAPTQSIIPTSGQQFQLDTQNFQRTQQDSARNIEETRRRAQTAVSDPGFYKMPELNRAVVWQQAGFDGNPPRSLEEWKAQQDYEHKLRLGEIGAQGANQIAAANARGAFGTGGRKNMPLGMINQFTELDDAINMASQMRDTHQPGDTGSMPRIGAAVPGFVTEMTKGMAGVEPGGFGAGAKNRQAQIALAKQIIGKGLEGGVLRKEDESKYADILPTIQDPDDVVVGKLNGLIGRLSQRRMTYEQAAEDGGYNLPDTRGQGRLNQGVQAQMPGQTGQQKAAPKFRITGVRPVGGR